MEPNNSVIFRVGAEAGTGIEGNDDVALTDKELEIIGDAIDSALGRYATVHRASDILSSLGITGLNVYRVLKIIHDALQKRSIAFDMHSLLATDDSVQQVEGCQVQQFAGLVAAQCTSR